ncbi:MAG TPA: dicarboxylate/amino acid:cation symporter, partial [Alphaproteobacteria bacterium]|nr:dicarboxylate/amino acid:cation symporter [Alphaproteobacteria bacterium]
MTREDNPDTRQAAAPLPLNFRHLSDHLFLLIRTRLWLQVLIAMVAGIVTGILLGPSVGWVEAGRAAVIGNWLAFPGQLFLALIQMIVIPLVFASIIRGLAAGGDAQQLRRTGLIMVVYFVATTALAIMIGLGLAYLIEPGRFVASDMLQAGLSLAEQPAADTPAAPAFAELPRMLLGLLPTNPLSAMVQAEMLQVVIFALVVGAALVSMAPAQSRPLIDLAGSLQEVCMMVVRWAMLLAPLAVFGLLAQLTSKIGLNALAGVAVYVLTVLLGLLLLLGVYLVILLLFARRGPGSFLSGMRELMLLAFSTSSSAAVMPLSIKTAQERMGVRPAIAQFVIPLGATINMNGTALYQGVAAIFLAQVFAVDVGPGGLLLLVVTAVGAAIGAPGTPGVGIVIMAMLLGTIGVPPAGIALIMGV